LSKLPVSALFVTFVVLLQKYDFLSAMMGALVVTTYFVLRGQSPLFAAGLTLMSTLAAVVCPYPLAFWQSTGSNMCPRTFVKSVHNVKTAVAAVMIFCTFLNDRA
jgi:hypothetical protein